MSQSHQDILKLFRASSLDFEAIEQALDGTDHETRLKVLHSFTPDVQSKLYEQAKGRTLTLEQMVPTSVPNGQPVRHFGQNTLPAFRQFEKRFCRPSKGTDEHGRPVLWGYNHQTFMNFTGPGYYVAYDDQDSGEVWIDYRLLPPETIDSWPEIISNRAKLGFLVYYNMVDRMRRVSEHLTIGRAYKKKPMAAYFALLREPL